MQDYRTNRLRTDWWHRIVFCGLTRNEISLIVVVALLLIGYYEMDWNWIFGRR